MRTEPVPDRRTGSTLLLAWTLGALLAATPTRSAAAEIDKHQAIAILRAAAGEGDVGAQLALASLLEDGTGADRAEAWRWYEAARAKADTTAAVRIQLGQARLASRVAPEELLPFAPRWSLPQRDASGRPPELQPGYHCHMLPFGQRFCHSGIN